MRASIAGIPRREWLAVLLPPMVGVILLVAGAAEARVTGAWGSYVVVATTACLVPLGYTAYLARRRHLFLRDAESIERNRLAISHAEPVTLLFALLITAAIGVAAGSLKAVLYAGLGGAAIGFWPGIVANFLRLWRERWSRADHR